MPTDDELRHVLHAAQAEADRQQTDITSAHLLLGLFHPPLSRAGRTLIALGVQPDLGKLTGMPSQSFQAAAEDPTVWPPPPVVTAPPVPMPLPAADLRLSRDAATVLGLAEREAGARGDHQMTPAHLVIGLLELRAGLAVHLLHMHGITLDTARRALYP